MCACVYINQDAVCLYAVIEGFHGSRWRLERSLHYFHAILFFLKFSFSFCRQQRESFPRRRLHLPQWRKKTKQNQPIVEFPPLRNDRQLKTSSTCEYLRNVAIGPRLQLSKHCSGECRLIAAHSYSDILCGTLTVQRQTEEKNIIQTLIYYSSWVRLFSATKNGMENFIFLFF